MAMQCMYRRGLDEDCGHYRSSCSVRADLRHLPSFDDQSSVRLPSAVQLSTALIWYLGFAVPPGCSTSATRTRTPCQRWWTFCSATCSGRPTSTMCQCQQLGTCSPPLPTFPLLKGCVQTDVWCLAKGLLIFAWPRGCRSARPVLGLYFRLRVNRTMSECVGHAGAGLCTKSGVGGWSEAILRLVP
jgi:hypothetical protein